MRFYSPAPICDVEEILAQAMVGKVKNNMHNLTVRKKKTMHSEKIAQPPSKKHNVANVQRFSEISLRLHCE